jgi:pyrimidine operon attenuation protein/uracil phosphoribosyltransferase
MEVLGHYQVSHKTVRIACEILENNLEEDEIIIAGINNNGYRFAEMIAENLQQLTDKKVVLTRIKLNPASPVDHAVTLEYPAKNTNGKTVVVVDDVANTGRTIFYAFKCFMDVLPKKVEVAVLVDRRHKQFPIKVDYVGLSLATTLQENIKANLQPKDGMNVLID